MESQTVATVTQDGETITEIQNYLASFNKEIQGNGAQDTSASAASPTTTQTNSRAGGDTTATTTFYVTTEGSQIQTFQSFDQTQAQFDGSTTTYFTPQYYSSQNQEDFASVSAYSGEGAPPADTQLQTGVTIVTGTEKPEEGEEIETQDQNAAVQQVAVTIAPSKAQDGLQQIVLAAASEGQEVAEGDEATEISVTIPASLASQAATEELLQAVEAHPSESDQPTFVAMQPDGQQVVAVSTSQTQPQMVTVEDGSQGITTYITQADTQGDSEVQNISYEQPQFVTGEQQIRMVVAEGQEEVTTGTLVTSDGHEIQVGEDNTLHMVASLAEQSSQNVTDEDNQVILNTGNAYQTVTIVPSDTNPGEVSYVLIVSQPEDVKDNGQKAGVSLDMSVYDFNEGEQHVATVEGEEAAPPAKPRIMKFSPKKSQAVSQAHMCNYCNYTSPKRYLLSRHMKSHSEERPHKCSVCERGFKTLASLQNHVNTHTGTRPHQCKECDSAFTTSGELVRHVRYKHTHEKPHKCTECDYASVELSKLKRHMRCHTGERPYQCPHCTYASPDTYKLKRHLRIHTGEKPYECDVCHARFTQSNSLKAHKLIHSGNKPIFQCELCPTTCGRKTDLRIHVQKLHTSDKPLKCKRCGKSFPDRYTYKVHVKTHEGEKCFKCDLCPYASISQRHLESHMLIHTDQKPYQCEQCDQAFRQKQLLKRHKNLYHDPDYVPPVPKEKTHECSECGRAFRHKGNLIRHMAIHDPDASAQEKAAALRLGRRRKIANGEEVTDEETDDEYDEESLDEQEGITLEASQMTNAEGTQVVVLEVIQLQGPEGEQQTVAVVAGDGMDANLQAAIDAEDANACKIIRKSSRTRTVDPQNDLHSGIYSIISEVMGEDVKTAQTPVLVKRGRGRPRRNPLPEHMEIAAATDKIELGADARENADDSLGEDGRKSRKRRYEDDSDSPMSPSKRPARGRPPMRGRRKEEDTTMPDEEEIARREAETAKRRLEQKQKDMEECFGFKDDDDEDDDEEESTVISSQNDTERETAIQLLAAMQQVESSLPQ